MTTRISAERLDEVRRYMERHCVLFQDEILSVIDEAEQFRSLLKQVREFSQRMEFAAKNSNSTRADYFLDYWLSELSSLLSAHGKGESHDD